MNATRLKPADFHRRAWKLMQQCWKLLLIAALLSSLLGWTENVLEAVGERRAQSVYDAHMTEFYAENSRPEDEEELIRWLYFDESFAKHDAQDAYDAAIMPYRIIGFSLDLLSGFINCMILVGMYTGLMMHQRAGEYTLHCLAIGFSRWKKCLRLTTQLYVYAAYWGLLALLPLYILDNFSPVLRSIGITVMALWISIYYALSYLHMAEDAEEHFTAKEYIDDAVSSMNFFTVRGLLRCSWPVWLLFVGQVLLKTAVAYWALPALPIDILCKISDVFRTMLLCAVYACVYDELRAHQEVSRNSEYLAES